MGWGGDEFQGIASHQQTFAPPKNDLPKPAPKAVPMYLQSVGYAQAVLKQAQRALGRTGTDFSDLFVVGPHQEHVRLFLAGLNHNELGALRVISETSPEELRWLGILK